MAGEFLVITYIELPDAATSLNLCYQNVTPTDSGKLETQALADAFDDQILNGPMTDLLSSDVSIAGCMVYKQALDANAAPPGVTKTRRTGTRGPEPLAANMGLQLTIHQSFFPSNRNAHNNIPGMSEQDSAGSTFQTAFMTTQVAAFHAALAPLLVETPNAGQWRLGVLSKKHLADNPGDFAGAFADATAASSPPQIKPERARTTHRRYTPI